MAEAVAEVYGGAPDIKDADEVLKFARAILADMASTLAEQDCAGLAHIAMAAACRFYLDGLEREDKGSVTLAGEKVSLALRGTLPPKTTLDTN